MRSLIKVDSRNWKMLKIFAIRKFEKPKMGAMEGKEKQLEGIGRGWNRVQYLVSFFLKI